ncbi:MAG: hypothetical protein ACJ763_13470 [Bdellovibrionia bacterium]
MRCWKYWLLALSCSVPLEAFAFLGMNASGHLYVVGTTRGGLDGNTLTGVQDLFACQYIGN